MASIITAIGNAKLIAATPINPVTIKSIAVGSGTGPFDPNITALKNQVWLGDSSAPQKIGAQLRFTCHIPASVGGWTITEWGLIDTSGDLIAYGQLDEPIYKPINLMSLEPIFIIELGDSSQADLVVTDTLNFDHNFLNNRSAADSHPMSAITGLNQKFTDVQTDITTKDGQNVKLTGNQVVGGEKTFNDTVHFETATNGAGQISMDAEGAAISASAGSVAGISLDGVTGIVNVTGVLQGDGSRLNNATESEKGVMEIATQAETNAGTDDTRAITPLKLKNSLNVTGSAPMFAARAWCSFNGATGAIRAGGNIASVTRTALGTYDVVFSVAMPDANYAVISTPSSGAEARSISVEGNTKTVNGFRLNAWYGGDNTVGKFDPVYADFTVFR